ncbi:hypothetical protein LIN78_00550 [Leeia sp. TBRC 13508]|uniref:Uncharacterized protein n=1 Tax=Leeia speluncae TaxID=2884804 RepID=A0ABS8D1I5_9NEIS|nr:hypothetical protein [Leeia speluncae]MCB6182045.1 hypothetical protein [Leeia speluncae]
MKIRQLSVIVLGLLTASAMVSVNAADGQWAKKHPRRAEVNAQLKEQNKAIHHEVKTGEMTKVKAKKLHQQNHHIRKEEQAMAKVNGGHITKAQQKVLHHQANKVQKKIS